MKNTFFGRWRANFFAGLAILLPAVASITIICWVFFMASPITDKLLFPFPREITHEKFGEVAGAGPMHWYWSLVALLLAVILTSIVGLLGRNYFGQRLIEWTDHSLLKVPFLNKIYGTTKQINEAFGTGDKTSFKTVVMIEFPSAGMHSVGFLTGEAQGEIAQRALEKMVCVFIPTTPNPTSGFMVLVPESKVTKLDMSVAEGLKFIISLGSISPEHAPHVQEERATLC